VRPLFPFKVRKNMKREEGVGKTIDRRVLIYDSPSPLNISSLW
jgi:hypothetical protein